MSRVPIYKHPHRLRLASLLHLLSRLVFFLSLVFLPILFLTAPDVAFRWLALPASIVPLALLWLLSASGLRCPVCRMRVLFNHPCEKSTKAPSLPLLGPHGTFALHGLFLRRIRCPYCGTRARVGHS